MEIAQLEAFILAADLGSFRRAADYLHLSQPSLSARIHSLEQELGVSLFHRMGRGVRLTEMGKLFLGYGEKTLSTLNQGKEAINSAMNASGGILNMASARNIGTYTMPSMLDKFRQDLPMYYRWYLMKKFT